MKKFTLLSLCALFVFSLTSSSILKVDPEGDTHGGGGGEIASFVPADTNAWLPNFPWKYPLPPKIDPTGDDQGNG